MSDTAAALQSRANRLVEDHANLLRALVELRLDHELTQREVGERMGVSQATVAKFERAGSNPTLATIRRYAMAVGAVMDTQVVHDCLKAREKRETFRAVVDHVDVGPSDALNVKKVPAMRIPKTWGRSVTSADQVSPWLT